MEKVIRVFHSFEEADAADAERWRNMTPEERAAAVIDLRELFPERTEPAREKMIEEITRPGD